jgi:hypothetical protein
MYCPFAKRQENQRELADDREALERFVTWVGLQQSHGHELSVFFTPWGEALIRRWYQQALVRLTRMPHVRKAAIQTNLTSSLEWVNACDLSKLALWCSYHPGETTRDRFLGQCRSLTAAGARYSVGIVGLKEYLREAYTLRMALPPGVYLWINAIKRVEDYYTVAETDAFAAIDPLFAVNNTNHPSLDLPCRAGQSVFSVDGAGTMRRCHFIPEPIGNIYKENWHESLRPATCTNRMCGCHIGYVHMPHLSLYEVFGDGVLERIPQSRIWSRDVASPALETTTAGKRLVRMSLRQVSASG